MKITHRQKGFTVIELLIATTVFSLVLMIFLSAFIKIGDMFYKGVNMANTQEAARVVLDGISSDIRFSKGTPYYIAPDPSGKGFFCVGQHRYKFQLAKQVGDPATSYGLLREDISSGGGCPDPAAVAGTNPTELLNNRMQLNRMDISGCGSGICTISILIVFYGSDPSVLVPNPQDPNAQCSGGITTSQFCATADYKSSVNRQT